MLIKPTNFITVCGWMVTDLQLKGNELLIYAIIYGFTQAEEQKYTGSQQYLADWIGSTRKTVRQNLDSLIGKGLITKEEVLVNGVKFCNYAAVVNDPGWVKITQGGWVEITHHNKEEHSKEERESKERNFDRWWSAYPRKVNKDGAKKVFLKLDVDIDAMMKALESQKLSEQWQEDDGRYIPHPTTYLNQHRWEGVEPTVVKPGNNLMMRGLHKR